MQRLQQRVAFERLLARLADGHWLLKGGFALELRYDWASRPTKDIDLRTELTPHDALDRLRAAIVSSPLHDHFGFELGETGHEMQGAPGGTVRVRVTARLAGADFASFHVDLSSGDPVVGEPDIVTGSELLGFAGIEPIRFPVYPLTQHLAEKLHAYTLPRDQENTRVKDFVDLVIVTAVDTVDGDALSSSLRATFDARRTHAIPRDLPEPPATWSGPYTRSLNERPVMPRIDLRTSYLLAAAFWNPFLDDQARGKVWMPANRAWGRREVE